MAVLDEVADLQLDPLLAPGGMLGGLRGGAAPRQLGDAPRQALAHLGHGGEDRLDHAQDVEHADLVRSFTEDCDDRLGVQRRAVGRDPLEDQATCLRRLVKIT